MTPLEMVRAADAVKCPHVTKIDGMYFCGESGKLLITHLIEFNDGNCYCYRGGKCEADWRRKNDEQSV